MTPIFRIFRVAEWLTFVASGTFEGSADDRRDGFIHMSTAEQAEGTRAKHYANVGQLVVAAFDADALKETIRWEPSRGGALFPHIYGVLPERALIGAAMVTGTIDEAIGRAVKGEQPA
ncbi:MAG TPA: DUF952 domain-containing protein [Alphaproteobacteria bacterium]|jgi:uncharacterized protein (DUF952 family)|nr:DUF952 domain-containing protein [Alphaproteobacteria bacterium]